MLRSAFLVFLAGWVIWFLIDKPPAGYPGLPHASDNMLDNFQLSFDMLMSGHLDMAYVFIWEAHYLVLSLIGGVLAGLLAGMVSNYLGRRRMRRHFLPPVRRDAPDAGGKGASETDPGPSSEK